MPTFQLILSLYNRFCPDYNVRRSLGEKSMHELKQVETESEWSAFHTIREDVLWKARGRSETYNRSHPEDRKPGHLPMLLIYDGAPIGVLRLDSHSEVAWFRRVAIREKGCRFARSNVDRAAVGFYRKLGFSEVENEHSDGAIPMVKEL